MSTAQIPIGIEFFPPNTPVGTEKLKVRARTASSAERGALWKQAVVFWPPYDDYQSKAGNREIPIVVLDPVS